ncbi:extensin family protein [Qipengyuania aurantiaca]|uniref:Extensin family protein n=1 Tax=Qipengyuania aurantiaca TaxID=2867233 RepID=A0ABX8ZRP5_9SPHN|nr:extensin family protein [Qipengyuania aurantiaca]QZD89853.1 extensin family protein [Qipengyuania aurantiaca]
MTFTISRRIGKFVFDRRVVLLLVLAGLLVAARSWLATHPEHNPWAPLDLNDPRGWATQQKLVALRDDVATCRAVLERSEVGFRALEPAGEGECRREDRTRLSGYPLSPDTPATTCPVAVAMELWKRDTLEPAAREIFGSEVARIEHLGAYSCRRMYGREDGPWSEHATANALDIAGFVLADGTHISVLSDWQGEGDKQRFLRAVRDGACGAFSTVLSPDYNAAHADHFHFDMDSRWTSVCR